MDEEVNRDDNGEADGMNVEVDSKDEVMHMYRMALRYFCAKLRKTAVSVCTYLWELNTQLLLGMYQKWSV